MKFPKFNEALIKIFVVCFSSWIFSTLPKCKQMIALSATYPKTLAEFLENYMNDPSHVRISVTDVTLIGK